MQSKSNDLTKTSGCMNSPGVGRRVAAMAALAVGVWLVPVSSRADDTNQTDSASVTNGFPSLPEVIGNQTFQTQTDEDIYFIRAIHDRYHDHWSDLLEANITLNDYVLSPDKLLRFVTELGEAMADRNDPDACTNLARLVNDPVFYADTNSYSTDITQSAAKGLIEIGPLGRDALASAFSLAHYRTDTGSLEDLAAVIGDEKPAGPEFVKALAATAFTLGTSNGSYYPRCITAAVKNLLVLPEGPAAVREHLQADEVLANPGRFQAVMDGIAAVGVPVLTSDLLAMDKEVRAKSAALADSPAGGYRVDLLDLDGRIVKAIAAGRSGSIR